MKENLILQYSLKIVSVYIDFRVLFDDFNRSLLLSLLLLRNGAYDGQSDEGD